MAAGNERAAKSRKKEGMRRKSEENGSEVMGIERAIIELFTYRDVTLKVWSRPKICDEMKPALSQNIR